MQINITGHHLEITESIREYFHQKAEKIERHIDQVNQINVILTVEKKDHIAEATLLYCGHEIFAKSEDADMYAAIDSLISKLDRQILKCKGKIQSH